MEEINPVNPAPLIPETAHASYPEPAPAPEPEVTSSSAPASEVVTDTSVGTRIDVEA
ncbi:MAG: hypothetical protein KA771_06315 [Spirochaetales bacterium]|mgnify:CR=1 FL=1|nr:hypothetical protein [Spirochaetales bacterium]